jgi:hypothetical protein
MFTAFIIPTITRTENRMAKGWSGMGSDRKAKLNASTTKEGTIVTQARANAVPASSLNRDDKDVRSSKYPSKKAAPTASSKTLWSELSGDCQSSSAQASRNGVATATPPTSGVGMLWVLCSPPGWSITLSQEPNARARKPTNRLMSGRTNTASVTINLTSPALDVRLATSSDQFERGLSQKNSFGTSSTSFLFSLPSFGHHRRADELSPRPAQNSKMTMDQTPPRKSE